MNVIAVDPSLRSTGVYSIEYEVSDQHPDGKPSQWAVTIRTKGEYRPHALAELFAAMQTILASETRYDFALVEGYSFGSRSSVMTVLGEVGGVIRLALEKAGVPVIEVAPLLWKSIIKTGQMGLPKHKGRKYREMVNEKFCTAWETPDECDAYMMALAVSRIWKKNCFTTEAAEKVRRQIEGVLQRQPHLISNPPRTGEEISVGGVK